jgi:hypothetical protein
VSCRASPGGACPAAPRSGLPHRLGHHRSVATRADRRSGQSRDAAPPGRGALSATRTPTVVCIGGRQVCGGAIRNSSEVWSVETAARVDLTHRPPQAVIERIVSRAERAGGDTAQATSRRRSTRCAWRAEQARGAGRSRTAGPGRRSGLRSAVATRPRRDDNVRPSMPGSGSSCHRSS